VQYLAALVAAFKGVQALRDIIDKFMGLWLTYQEAQEDATISKQRKVRSALINSMKQPGLSNEERAIIRQHLFDLYFTGKLPKQSSKT